ncbi:MAG: LytTR family DNA-binding domain-containing protein [Lachnospiraceae bacterium]|jgi:DNA-binding LytR/AlgR family response regulator|nr:LytTR family DNA-binding domain-containing protein [Lachnospiraceae bacterium]
MLRVAICDNNIKDRNILETKLNQLSKEAKITMHIEKFSAGYQFKDYWSKKENEFDILFLDVNLPDESGLDLAKDLRKLGYKDEIIFNSREKSEVFESFDVKAFHYIVKDEISDKREKEIFVHAYEEVCKEKENYITVCCGGESLTIPVNIIKYFEAKRNIINVHYGKNQSFEFYTSLMKLELSLVEKGFVRVSKNTIINIAYVRKYSKLDVTLKNGTRFDIGRAYRKKVVTIIEEYMKSKEVLLV